MEKLKSIFLAVFMLSLSLPIYAQSASESEEMLKMVANELNSECPMDYGNDIAMTSVTYSNKILEINMDMPIIDDTLYPAISDTFRDSFLQGLFGTEGGEFIYEWMNTANVKLNIVFKLKGGAKRTMTFTPSDLRKYMNTH